MMSDRLELIFKEQGRFRNVILQYRSRDKEVVYSLNIPKSGAAQCHPFFLGWGGADSTPHHFGEFRILLIILRISRVLVAVVVLQGSCRLLVTFLFSTFALSALDGLRSPFHTDCPTSCHLLYGLSQLHSSSVLIQLQSMHKLGLQCFSPLTPLIQCL